MARPEQRTAAKDYPQHGIAKGEKYYYVSIKTGPRSSRVMRQKEPFRRSQLTQSEYLAALFDWEDEKAAIADMDDAQEFADRIRELGEEQQGKFDNMPEGLQQGESGQLLEARANACEAAADEIESIIADWETAKDEHETAVAEYEAAKKAADEAEDGDDADAFKAALDALDALDEPDEDFDDSEFIDNVRDVSVDG